MRAVVFAYHAIGHRGLATILEHGFQVAAVFTHCDDPHENVGFPSVAELASSQGIEVFAPEDVNHPLWVERLRRLRPEIIFSIHYRKLLGKKILAIPPQGSFNLHSSLLPRYRGRCPLNWVLVHGERETGVTLHRMTSRPDAGNIVDQVRVPISDADTAPTLYARLQEASGELWNRTLPRILAGTATETPQDTALATVFGGRSPQDGEIDFRKSAVEVRNLVRAVTRPWPGAFTHSGRRKVLIWSSTVLPAEEQGTEPGRITSVDPLVVECGRNSLRIDLGQVEGGLPLAGSQLASELNLVPGLRLASASRSPAAPRGRRKVLILGVNGFIGSALGELLLGTGRHEVIGMDLSSHNIAHLVGRPGFRFTEGDISIHREWIEYNVRNCDVILPLVAIATPIEYTRNPLRVFELDFEENLKIVRYAAKYGKRIIFPSTSEVYGMCDEPYFDEDTSKLVLGPIHKERWIYACAKQLLDRVIWAYGKHHGLRFTLFRPFNWIGPRLDSIDSARIGSSRAITQLILNLVEGSPIQLIDGGEQKRCFTDVSEGVDCLRRIIEDDSGGSDGQIINVGNPDNEASIRELATMLVERFEEHPLRSHFPPFAGFREVESRAYYGAGYEDMQHRRPRIRNAKRFVGWVPRIGLEESVDRTLDYFLRDHLAKCGIRVDAPRERART